MFSELHTQPGCTSVNASSRRLPDDTHHSRPRRLARSYLVRLLHSLPFSGFRRRTLTPLICPCLHGSGFQVCVLFRWPLLFQDGDAAVEQHAPLLAINRIEMHVLISGGPSIRGKVGPALQRKLHLQGRPGADYGLADSNGGISPHMARVSMTLAVAM
jgi:hypothetical protein